MTTHAEQEAREQERAEAVAAIKHEREQRDMSYSASNRLLALHIEDAREIGVPWREIAEAMGMTRHGVLDFLRRHGG